MLDNRIKHVVGQAPNRVGWFAGTFENTSAPLRRQMSSTGRQACPRHVAGRSCGAFCARLQAASLTSWVMYLHLQTLPLWTR